MGKAQPIEILDQHFIKKTDVLKYMKAMLNRYHPGDIVDVRDAKFLAEALMRHPERKSKIGSSPDHFEVRSADYGTQCFG